MHVDIDGVWDGARNHADLGGLELTDGGETVRRRVWRSAAREWMTGDGWRAAREAGLVCVIDLRNGPEIGRRSVHPAVDDTSWAGVAVVNTPTEDPDDRDFLDEWGRWLDHPRSWTPTLRHYPEKVADVFAAIADADGPVLIHCAGGRDRTGMICAMLLSLAGVEAEAIVADYEAGFRRAGQYTGPGQVYDPSIGTFVDVMTEAWTLAELTAAMDSRIPALREWLAEFDAASFLMGAGVDPGRTDWLRRRLRE